MIDPRFRLAVCDGENIGYVTARLHADDLKLTADEVWERYLRPAWVQCLRELEYLQETAQAK